MSRKPENTSSKQGAIAVAGYKTSIRVFAGKLEIAQGESVEYIHPGRFRSPRCMILLHPNGFMTFDAMTWLAQNGIPMISVNWQDETTNILISDCSVCEALYNKELVDTQLALASDPVQALAISKSLICAKIQNSVSTLHDLGAPAGAVGNCQTQVMRARNHNELLGAEGKAALAYFTQWRNLPLQWKPNKRRPIPDDWNFVGPRRSQIPRGKHTQNRHATQPVNALLNYGYAVLAGRVKLAIACAGLDPNIGFMHAPQRETTARRLPLVLDLVEPMRPLIDGAVLKFATETVLDQRDFEIIRTSPVFPTGAIKLSSDIARQVAVIADDALTFSPVKLLPQPLQLLPRQ